MAVKGNYNPYKFLQLLLSAIMFVPSLSLAPFRINQGESLNASSSLVSEQFFTLGFLSLGIDEPNNRSYLGIGIDDPTNPFWIGNRDKPISDNSGMLSIDGSGALKLNYSGGDLVKFYSSGQSTGNNLSAILRRDGNLVLRDGNSGEALWESFDHPTDTLLPGMKLGTDHRTRKSSILVSWLSDSIPSPGAFTLEWNYTSKQLVVKRRGVIFWTANMTESYYEDEFPEFPGTSLSFSYSIVSNTDEDYFAYSVALIKGRMIPGQRDFTKWQLTYDGNILDMNSGLYFLSSSWCDGNSTEHGCRRWEGPHCRNGGDKFDTRSGTFDASPEVDDNSSISISDCMDMCWKNCSCVATRTFHSNGTGCLFCSGNFTPDPSGSSPKYSIIIRPDMDSSGKKKRIWILPALLAFALIMATVIILLYIRRRRNRERLLNELLRMDTKEEGNDNENDASDRGRNNLKFYSLTTIMTATNNFSPENKLGQGGFGPVFKGKLLEGKTIAVKRLSRSSGQGMLEFKNELILIAKLQHMNLVRLLGCCIHGEERMLVYEYMPNKSLDSFIFDESKKTLLNWNMRLKIIEGIAQGMLYLHKYSRLKIIHRDLKASNILLDENFNPKISDFGMARIFKTNTIEANTDRVVGTYGYMSPEYAMRGVFSVKSDVFSFGVLMLEIISGKKNHTIICINEPIKLIGYAWELWKQGNALELTDPILIDSCPKDQMLRCIQVGLLCVQDNALDRPVMSEVVTMLRCEVSQIPSPKQPAFTDPGGIIDTKSIMG